MEVGWIAAIIIGGIAGWLAEQCNMGQVRVLKRRCIIALLVNSVPD